MFVRTQVLPAISIGFRHILGLKSTMHLSTKGTIGKEMSTSWLYDAGYSSEAGVSNRGLPCRVTQPLATSVNYTSKGKMQPCTGTEALYRLYGPEGE